MHNFMANDEVTELSDWRSLTYLLKFIRPFGFYYGSSLFFMAASAGCVMLSARALGIFVQEVCAQQHYEQSTRFIASILILELCGILLVWAGRKIMVWAGSNTILLIRQALFRHLQVLPTRYFDHTPEGRTITRLTNDVESMEQFFNQGMGRVLQSMIIFFAALVAMLLTDWRIGGLLMICMLPSILLTWGTKNKIRMINRNISKFNSAANSQLAEYLRGAETIRIFGMESYARENYHDKLQQHLKGVLASNKFYAWARPSIIFLTYFPLMVLFLVGGKAVLLGSWGVGVFLSFVRFAERFAHPISMLTQEIHIIQQAFTAAERLTSFFTEEQEDQVLGPDGHYRGPLRGEIVFEQVSMSYDPGRPVLHNVSLAVQAGEKIGIIGRTGSGKTTLVSLLTRQYPFTSGEIFFDQRPIGSIARGHLRSQIGFVSQDVVIFHGTLRENLLCGEQVLEAELIACCQATGLWQLMEQHDLRFEDFLLDHGANLGQGEKQLISLTRILIKKPAMLILDEATANIDPTNEQIVQTAISKVMENRTCLIIAHRLETLGICDRIFVFQQGQLQESSSMINLNSTFQSQMS